MTGLRIIRLVEGVDFLVYPVYLKVIFQGHHAVNSLRFLLEPKILERKKKKGKERVAKRGTWVEKKLTGLLIGTAAIYGIFNLPYL